MKYNNLFIIHIYLLQTKLELYYTNISKDRLEYKSMVEQKYNLSIAEEMSYDEDIICFYIIPNFFEDFPQIQSKSYEELFY